MTPPLPPTSQQSGQSAISRRIGELDVVVVNFFVVDEREFEDVGTLTRKWIGDWTSSRADAEEGAVEEELRRKVRDEARRLVRLSPRRRVKSNGMRKVTPARQMVPSAPKFTAVPETVS